MLLYYFIMIMIAIVHWFSEPMLLVAASGCHDQSSRERDWVKGGVNPDSVASSDIDAFLTNAS